MNCDQAAAMFSALSQETRLEILRYLVSCGDDGAPAGKISDAVGAAASRASFHLAALEKAGLISAKKQSRFVIYRAAFSEIGGLVSFLLNDCCHGHPDILSCCLPSPDPCC